jgi:hypothetical protein
MMNKWSKGHLSAFLTALHAWIYNLLGQMFFSKPQKMAF